MALRVLPSPPLLVLLTVAGAVLMALGLGGWRGLPLVGVALCAGVLLVLVVLLDVRLSTRQWRAMPLTLTRQLPRAFAVTVPVELSMTLENNGARAVSGQLFELGDPTFQLPTMPLAFHLAPRQRQTLRFPFTPTERGAKVFGGVQVRVRSPLQLLDWDRHLGTPETRRVFPNFAQQAAFDWLTGARRLATIGIKSFRRRGSATDFDELVEYRAGDAIRHIDWKATLKHERPILRKYQDDRDQSVFFLLDCGRRMRADETQVAAAGSHFDQALNAMMLLAFVAAGKGDAVGAMTFGTAPAQAKRCAPRKGRQALNALMTEFCDVQAAPVFSDYITAAGDCMRHQRKRGLLVMITNCRDEEADELRVAATLLRSRHLVIVASLREEIVGQIAAQDLDTEERALEAAAALGYEQRRRDTLRRLALGGVMMIDCEPQQLGVELVNRYTALKRIGAI